MTAIATGRLATRFKLNPGDRYFDRTVDTGETVYPGAFVGLRAGKLCDADLDDDYVVAGVTTGRHDQEGANATAGQLARVREGVVGPFAQTGATITIAHCGRRAYLADNQTLTLARTSSARCAGVIVDVTDDGVWVETGLALCAALQSAPEIQYGTGTLVAGVLTVDTTIHLSDTSLIHVWRVTEGGTDGDEIRVQTADRTHGDVGTAAFTARAFLDGVAATSDTSTVAWEIIG